MNDPDSLYSVGECPVDPGFGQVLVLMRVDTATAVYFCPACGTAWSSPPGDEVNEVRGLNDLAPAGVMAASERNLDEMGIAGLVRATVPYSEWKSDLDEVLTLR